MTRWCRISSINSRTASPKNMSSLVDWKTIFNSVKFYSPKKHADAKGSKIKSPCWLIRLLFYSSLVHAYYFASWLKSTNLRTYCMLSVQQKHAGVFDWNSSTYFPSKRSARKIFIATKLPIENSREWCFRIGDFFVKITLYVYLQWIQRRTYNYAHGNKEFSKSRILQILVFFLIKTIIYKY